LAEGLLGVRRETEVDELEGGGAVLRALGDADARSARHRPRLARIVEADGEAGGGEAVGAAIPQRHHRDVPALEELLDGPASAGSGTMRGLSSLLFSKPRSTWAGFFAPPPRACTVAMKN